MSGNELFQMTEDLGRGQGSVWV